MAWTVSSSDARLTRFILTILGVVTMLHMLYLLRDAHGAWKARAHATSSSAMTTGNRTGPPMLTDANGQPAYIGPDGALRPLHNADGLPMSPSAAAAVAAAAMHGQHAQPFPRRIWQTGRDGPATLDDESVAAIATWTKLNQDWRYEILTDASAETYVRGTFAHRPDIVATYMALRDPILRADMLRYLVLLGHGGVYSDMDTKALKPIDDWIPAAHRDQAAVVVGIEYDREDGGRWVDWTLDLQFTNWAMLAQPSHPMLDLTVQKLIYNLHALAARQGTTLAGIKPAFHEVLDTTGPALFSRAIFEYLDTQTDGPFDWHNITKLRIPRLVGDVLILPVTSFGNGQPHSSSGAAEEQIALVQHLFRGSWKDAHPMKGEEEQLPNEQEKHEEPQEFHEEHGFGEPPVEEKIQEHELEKLPMEAKTQEHGFGELPVEAKIQEHDSVDFAETDSQDHIHDETILQ